MLKIQHAIPFLLLLAGCAVRQPTPRAWRFAGRTLIPPGVISTDLAEGRFTAPITLRRNCLQSDALTILRRHSAITVAVHREALLRQPRGWLTEWIDRSESEGCIPNGQGSVLAARILESLPLPAGAALRLLRADSMPNYVELSAGDRLQVISPLLRSGAAAGNPAIGPSQVSGDGSRLTVEMKSSADLIGFETAWYEVVSKPSGPGFTIVPTSAEVNLRGNAEARDAPATNYFQFPPQIAFYRLFFKADQSEVLALATTRAGLPTGPETCDKPGGPVCFAIPRGVGVNPYMRIEVNGSPLAVAIGATIRGVLQTARQRPEVVMPTLTITKPFRGRPLTIEFDRAKQDILNLVLTGNEQVRW